LPGRLRGSRSLIFRFDPRESEDEDELAYEYDWVGLRTIERKEKRAIEYQIFLEISSSYLVFVLQS
jgi:hypothetical protein